jgi:hypothetical protein
MGEMRIGKSHGPDGPHPRMKELRLTAGWWLFENRNYEEKWPNLKMVETTPLGKWSGRR